MPAGLTTLYHTMNLHHKFLEARKSQKAENPHVVS